MRSAVSQIVGVRGVANLSIYIKNPGKSKAIAEDAEDITAFEERAKEPLVGYDEMVKRLKKDGRI